MSGPDDVREEIAPGHPLYAEATEPGFLEKVDRRAVGYLWKSIMGKQRFTLDLWEELGGRYLDDAPAVVTTIFGYLFNTLRAAISEGMRWLFG